MLGNTKEKLPEKKFPTSTAIVVISACIYIIVGLLLLLVPQIQIITLSYIFSTVLIITGIVFIVQYFMNDSFVNISQYGFSIGVLCVILGVCAMVRAERVSGYFILCMGIFLLISAVIKLQNSLALKALEEKSWVVFLVISILIVICSMVIIIDPFSKVDDRNHFTYIVLVGDGILTLVSTFFLSIQIKRHQKKSYVSASDDRVTDNETIIDCDPQGMKDNSDDETI